jgi:hypothetical protein
VFQIQVFGKDGCAKCTSTKQKLTHLLGKWQVAGKVEFGWFDMATEEGLAEGAFNDVDQIPTTLLMDDSGTELARWEAQIPPSDGVKQILADAGIVQA